MKRRIDCFCALCALLLLCACAAQTPRQPDGQPAQGEAAQQPENAGQDAPAGEDAVPGDEDAAPEDVTTDGGAEELTWSPFTVSELCEILDLTLDEVQQRYGLTLEEDDDGPSACTELGGLTWKLSFWTDEDGTAGGILLQHYWLAADWTDQELPAYGSKSDDALAESFDCLRQCFADFQAEGTLPEDWQEHLALEDSARCLLDGSDGAAFSAGLREQSGETHMAGSSRYGVWQLGRGLGATLRYEYLTPHRGAIQIWLQPEP